MTINREGSDPLGSGAGQVFGHPDNHNQEDMRMKRKSSGAGRALVTGGAGFIGSHLCEELLDRGFSVSVVDDLSTGCRSNLAGINGNGSGHFEFHRGSIMSRRLMDRLISGCDIVFHLAAAVGVKYILEKPVDSILTNIEGTSNILRLSAKHGRKVVVASSSEVYGKNAFSAVNEESDEILGPTTVARWSYGNSKAADEFLALAYAKERSLPVVIVRLFNIVGPRQVAHYGMVLPRFIHQALASEPLTVYGDGSQVRSFTYVKDAVKVIADLSAEPKAEGQIFNIGADQPISIGNLALKVKKRTGSNSSIRYIPYGEVYGSDFEDVRCRIPDVSKIRKLLRFSPEYDIDRIVDSTVEHFLGGSDSPGGNGGKGKKGRVRR
jgi:UDP-glucose 4-epimerase